MKAQEMFAMLLAHGDEKQAVIESLSNDVVEAESESAVLTADLETVTAERDALLLQIEAMTARQRLELEQARDKSFKQGVDEALTTANMLTGQTGAKFARVDVTQLFGGNR